MVKIKRFLLIIGIHWVLVLPFWALCRILILNNYSGCKLGVHLDPVPILHRFHKCSGCTRNIWVGNYTILPASFYGWNVIDNTRNRQVIQVYSSLVRTSDLKIANQNNNMLTTMITDDPTTNHCRSVEAICIRMITRFDRLMFVFKDLSDFKHRIFRSINAKNRHLARNAKCRFCDFIGSQAAVQNHIV